MPQLAESIPFSPTQDFAKFLESIPAKWVIYLLSDEQDHPFQLLSVKNLRSSLENRLCEHPADERTRSIPYRQVVRKVSWQRVDSQAEADWIYAQLARELFPHAYRKMIDSWSAWYVQIDPEAEFPRYTVTDKPSWELSRTTFGPIPSKAAAQKFIETIEDAFDLCRYYSILTQAPNAQACAYKQMHKCPAPCDGSISMGMYHHQIEQSIQAIGNRQMIIEHEGRMRQAATSLKFELAGKIKAYVEQLKSLSAGQFEHVRPLSELRQIAVLRGPKAKTHKLMLLTPEHIELTAEWSTPDQIAQTLETFATQWEELRRWDEQALDRLTFISRQLMLKSHDCIFTTPSMDAIKAATTQLSRRKVEAESTEEGVIQELQ